MAAPDQVAAGEIWLGTVDTEHGYYQADEVTYAQLAQFIRKMTIGDATKDSDDYISTWVMGNFTGGGQVEEINEGAETDRFYIAFADTTAANRNALPPLVTAVRPNSNCSDGYVLDVGNDGVMYVAFNESGTWEVWGYNESTGAFDYNGGAGVALGAAPAGKAVRFDGVIYVPLGASGYSRITGSAGTPTVATVAGAADPTTAAPTSAPRPLAFAIFHQRLWAITTGGGIAYHTITQKDAAANAWHWPVGETTTDFPHIEASATPKALAVFPDKNGVESLYVKTTRGVLIFDDNNPGFFETHVEFPPHPDINQSLCIWPPGGDLHAPVGLNDVKYSTAFVVDPKFGLARDHGLPPTYRGVITDVEPTVDRLYAIVGGVLETASAEWTYNDSVGSAGTGNGEFADVRGLSLDSAGNVFACDENNERVQKFDSALTFTSVIISGGAGTGNGQFASDNGPYDLAHDASNNMFVVDRGNSRVQKFNSSGTYQSQFGSFDDGTAAVGSTLDWTLTDTHGSTGSGDDNFDTPAQVAVDSSGNTYTADSANNRLIKRDSSGAYVAQAEPWGVPMTGIAVDASGNVYAYHPSDITLTKSNSSLALVTFKDNVGTFNQGKHIATDGTHLYVVASTGTIQKRLCSDLSLVSTWGSSGTGNGQFDQPWGIAYGNGEVYVVDSGNSRVQVFNTSGVYQRQWPLVPGFRGIAYSPTTGRVLVAGTSSDTVYEYTSTGTLVNSFPQADADGIAVDSGGTVWVTNAVSDNLAQWDYTGDPGTPAEPPDDGKFDLPQAIDIKASSGRIYVVDTGNHRVQYFTSAGVYEGKFGSSTYSDSTGAILAGTGNGEFNTPVDLAVNQTTGNVYVVDQGNDRVQYFSATGAYLGQWGSSGSGTGQFQNPTVIAVNPATGNVFVGDSTRDDVQEFTATGGYIRAFGASGSSNGQFNAPSGIAISADGDTIFVADLTNEDIQAFTHPSSGALSAIPSLHCWTGVGWHGLWQGADASASPRWLRAAAATDGYRLWWTMSDGYAYHTKLRRTFHNARTGFLAGIDNFAEEGVIETGFFDAAMEGFDKIVSHITFLDAVATADETITVSFKCDSGGWESLGTITNAANKQSLPFDVVDGFSKGRQLNKIAFKFELARGSIDTNTPLIDAVTMHFTKIPQNTTSFNVSLPLSPYKGRSAYEQYNDLTALVTAGQFLPLVHRRDSTDSDGTEVSATYRVLIAAVSGVMDTGASGTARADLSLIAIADGT